jgi:hypothetical protein
MYNYAMVKLIPLTNKLQTIWDTCYEANLLKLPYQSYNWICAYFNSIGKNDSPYTLHLPDQNIIAPFIINNHQLKFSGGVEVSDYLDLIGPDKNKPHAWPEIMKYAQSQGVKTICLNNISESSPTHDYFNTISKLNRTIISIDTEDTTPIFELPADFNGYLNYLSHKNRHELERKMRKFERENPEIRMEDKTGITNNIDILLNLMHQDEAKNEFLKSGNETFIKEISQTIPESQFLTLYLDEKPAAAIMAYKVNNSFLLYNSGFDKDSHPGAGFYLKVQSIKYAIENGFKYYNFLQGDERYKYELGGRDSYVYRINITFKPTV